MPRWLLLAIAVLSTACSQSPPSPTATATATLAAWATSTSTPSPATAVASTPLESIGPSPTPLIHVVEQGDTLLGIAIIYGVELADLVLANPDVNPRFLSVGTGLLIPNTGVQSTVATATPYPLMLSPVRCFPELNGGWWCLSLATPSDSQALEAVIALVSLLGADGGTLRTEPAFSPINLLGAESVLPLVAYFTAPVPEFASASAVLISALEASDIEQRYPRLEVEIQQRHISEDRRSGVVSGTVRMLPTDLTLQAGLRLVALALDDARQPVGVRVWEFEGAVLPDDGVAFEILVASLGPPIAELVLLSEAR